MSIGDWDVFGDLARLRRDLGRFSREASQLASPAAAGDAWAPPVDVYEQENTLVLLVDLPGVRREDIQLRVDHDSLTIEGQRLALEDAATIRSERPVGRFHRSFRIATPVDLASTQAVYRDGVLRLLIPRGPSGQSARVRVRIE
ncbi:MAG: Hsp20/alpha crystallin family protein [Armatimonadota bacterium]